MEVLGVSRNPYMAIQLSSTVLVIKIKIEKKNNISAIELNSDQTKLTSETKKKKKDKNPNRNAERASSNCIIRFNIKLHKNSNSRENKQNRTGEEFA